MNTAEKTAWLYREFGQYDADRSGEFLVPTAEAGSFVELLAQLDIEWIDTAELFSMNDQTQIWEGTVHFNRTFSLDGALAYTRRYIGDNFAISFSYDIFDDMSLSGRAAILTHKSDLSITAEG